MRAVNAMVIHKYLAKALQYIASHEGVWLTTSDEIAASLCERYPDTKNDRLRDRGGWSVDRWSTRAHRDRRKTFSMVLFAGQKPM